jgi:hypothetical protein
MHGQLAPPTGRVEAPKTRAQAPVSRPATPAPAVAVRATIGELDRASAPPALGRLLARAVLARKGELMELYDQQTGVRGLSAAERRRLDALVGGTTSISGAAPAELRKLLDAAGTGELGADALRKFLKDETYLTYLVQLASGHRGKAKTFSVGPASAEELFRFPGAWGFAKRRTVTVRIPLLQWSLPFAVEIVGATGPTRTKPGDGLPTVANVAQVLSELPVESLLQIKEVWLSPAASPNDAELQKKLNDPTAAAYMTAGAYGIVTVYPSSNPNALVAIESAMLHESGHTLSLSVFGSDTADKRWDQWRDARKADAMSVSTYGKTTDAEDFAEAWGLWIGSRGTEREKEVETLFPNRVRVMQAMCVKGR